MNLLEKPYSNTHARSSEVFVLCPKALFDRLNSLSLSKTMDGHLRRLVGACLYTYHEEKEGVVFYKEMSKKYILKVTSYDFYTKVFPTLRYRTLYEDICSKEDSIFQTNGKYDKYKNIPLYYRLNPELMKGPAVKLHYKLILENDALNHLFPEVIEHFIRSYSASGIHYNLFSRNAIEERAFNYKLIDSNFCYVNRSFDESMKFLDVKVVPNRFVKEVTVFGRHEFMKTHLHSLVNRLETERSKLPEKERKDVMIIIDKDKVYIANVFYHIKKRTEASVKAAKHVAGLISNKECNPLISGTNGRFTTPVTSFVNFGIKYLTLNGKPLVSMDLKSSQVVILVNLMTGPKDFIDSLKESKYKRLKMYMDCFLNLETDDLDVTDFLEYLVDERSDIYKEIAKDLGINRVLAKPEMFRILFSEPNQGYSNYTIKKNFPDFFVYLERVKAAFAYKFGNSKQHLAYFLTFVEAHIFIERIYVDMAFSNILGFTKHDSALVEEDTETIQKTLEIINQLFAKLHFKGSIKLESDNVIGWLGEGICTGPIDEFVASGFLYENQINDFSFADLETE